MTSSYRPVLDAVGSIAVLHDRENRLVEMNTVAERFTGYRTADLRGQPFFREVVAADDVDRYRRQFAVVAEDVLPNGYETWWSLRDGSRRLVVWTHRPLPTADGELLLTTAFDLTDRRDREERLQYLAYHDDLTGLANRRRFLEELEHRLAWGRRYAEPVAVLMLDVDGLKDVNDRLGHPAGDDVLHEVAARIRTRLRTSDMAARLGGDEFAVLLSRADRERAEHVARDIAATVAARPLLIGRGTLAMTVSTGAAAFPDDATTSAGVLRAADDRLYAGRSRRRSRDLEHPPVPDERRIQAVFERQARRAEMARRPQPAGTTSTRSTSGQEEVG